MAPNASPLWQIQTAVYSLLAADTILAAKITGVYDEVGEGTAYPYVVVGDFVLTPQGALDRYGARSVLPLHVWSSYHGTREVTDILDEVIRIIDHQTLMVAGHATVAVRLEQTVTLRDPGDQDLRHGVARFSIETESAA